MTVELRSMSPKYQLWHRVRVRSTVTRRDSSPDSGVADAREGSKVKDFFPVWRIFQRALSNRTRRASIRYCDAIFESCLDDVGRFFTKSSTASRMSDSLRGDVMTGVESRFSEGWLPLH